MLLPRKRRHRLDFVAAASWVFVHLLLPAVCFAAQAPQDGVSVEFTKYLQLDNKQIVALITLNRKYASEHGNSNDADLAKIKAAINDVLTGDQKTRLKTLADSKCKEKLQAEARSLHLLEGTQPGSNVRNRGFGGTTRSSKTTTGVCEDNPGKTPPSSPPQ
jgi:hypothetical protein